LNKIIIYSEISWSFLDQRHHHLARYFASKGFHVEFVERVVSRIPSVSYLFKMFYQKIIDIILRQKNSSKQFKSLPKNVSLRKSYFLSHTYIFFNWYNYLVWWFVERPRQAGAVVYSFVDSPFIIGKNYHLSGLFKLSVFDIIHNWWDFPWKSDIHQLNVDFCVDNYDYIITDSQKIFDKLKFQKVESHLMLPGISEAWLDYKITEARQEVKAVFFGNLRTNSDIQLINQIAVSFGIDLYGIVDHDVQALLSSSAEFCGRVDAEELPRILNNYNVIVLPYNDSEFSSSISPAKFFEALATGCTVVTRSNLSHVVGFDRFCVHLQSLDEIKGLNNRLLSSGTATEQLEFASKHTWVQRFDALCEFIGLSNV